LTRYTPDNHEQSFFGGNRMIEVTEVSIAQLRNALESGQTTAVELVQAYLARIDAYDGADTPPRSMQW
jgi:amidase